MENTNNEVAAIEAPDFLSSLPEDLRAEPSLSKFKDVGSLAKSLLSLEKMVGGRIPIPTAEAPEEIRKEFLDKISKVDGIVKLPTTPEEEAAFRARLGVPAAATEYKLELPEELHNVADESIAEMLAKAHEAGLNNKQATAIVKSQLEKIANSRKEEAAKAAEAEATLKKLFGSELESRVVAAKKVASIMNDKVPGFEEFALNNMIKHPEVMLMLTELAKNTREPNSITGKSVATFNDSPFVAAENINAIKKQAFDTSNPNRKAAMAEYDRLLRILVDSNSAG